MSFQSVLEIGQALIFPVLGFAAGFVAQWYLQERRARDELVRALAQQRADALRELWKVSTLPEEIASSEASSLVPESLREELDRSVVHWYTKLSGALFLSWDATQLLFKLLDALRSEQTDKQALEGAVSALRAQLKRDCGIYSRTEAAQQLTRPRAAPWSRNGDA